MYQRRRARVLLAALVLVTLVLITVDFRSGERGPLSALRGFATTVFAPIQDGLATVLAPVGDAIGSVGDLFDLREENARLRGRLEQLEERRRSFEDLARENAELRALLGVRDRLDLETVPARVIANGPSNFEWTATLDVGSDQGVRRDMVVVNQDGLVGRVLQVTPGASRILLAIDPNFKAAAHLADSGKQGRFSGEGSRSPTFQPFDPEADIEVDDELVTSQYSNSVFPAGIPIGAVEDAGGTTSSASLAREVTVRPYVDFTNLDFVLVVLHEPVADLPPLEDEPDAPFTPPVVPSPEPSTTPGGTA